MVYLNAESLSGMVWETWSLRRAPLPSTHPFSDDGSLFFSAYGDTSGLPAPAHDPAFDEAREAARPERDEDGDED